MKTDSKGEKRLKGGAVSQVALCVKHLVEKCIRAHRRSSAEKDQRILLDVEVDGVRCVLLRSTQGLATGAAPVTLSQREEQIARMVALGHPNKTIAAELKISAWTVSTYLRRIFGKLSVTSRAAMVAQLWRVGPLVGAVGAGPRLAPDPFRRGESASRSRL